jgi:exopolysaccharide biosynthesis polyprenyl glycosylphosphotransferase
VSTVPLTLDSLVETLDERTVRLLEHRKVGRLKRRGWLVRRALLIADLLGLIAAYAVAQVLFATEAVNDRVGPSTETTLFLLSLPAWIVMAKLYGLYDRDEERTDHSTAEDLVRVFHLVTVGAWAMFLFLSLTSLPEPRTSKQLAFWSCGIAGVSIARVIARTLCRRNVSYLQNTVIVGAGDVGQLIARKILQHREYGLNLVGFVDEAPKERRSDLGHLTILGAPDELPELVRLLDVERVIVAFTNAPSDDLVALVRALRDTDVQIDVVPRLFDVIGPSVDVHDVEGLPVLSLRPPRMSRSSRLLKRFVDVIGASIALVLASPIFAYIAWRVHRDSPGPVFFRQSRLGMDGKEFTFLKFRSMRVGTDPGVHAAYIARSANGTVAQEGNGLFKLEQLNAVTPFGKFLRRTSLDELPQLINVLRGDMSLVGPRPCIPYETEHFEPHHFDRFNVPAGLTGLWQVTARANSTFREALDLDVAYARSWSLGLDLQLLLRTPLQLLRPRGTR